VGVVHGLQRNARVIAIEVAVLDEVFDRVYNLASCQYPPYSGYRYAALAYLLEDISLFEARFKH
jgi:hypothetical protein